MSHQYVKQFVHTMWSTHDQQPYITNAFQNNLYAYISSLVKSQNGNTIAIGGYCDHIHLLITIPPTISIVGMISHLKAYSSKWAKKNIAAHPNFSWQKGFVAMSTQDDKIDNVCSYIRSDHLRHASKNYKEELQSILKQQNINYTDKYLLQNSFSKNYIHMIWATDLRYPFLEKTLQPKLYLQVKTIISSFDGIVHEVGGVNDHIHILLEAPKKMALADLVRETKTRLTHWLKAENNHRFNHFAWQTGYGAFTVSHSGIDGVKQYIQNQEEHHFGQSLNEEWNHFLLKNGCLTMS